MSGRFVLGLVSMIVLAVLIGLVAAHGQTVGVAAPAPTVAPTAPPLPPSNQVDIVSSPSGNPTAYYFSATSVSSITVRNGDTVTWTNTDTRAHSVTADNGAFNSGALNPKQSFRWKAKTGTYRYGCFIHPDMQGTIIVQP